LLLSVPATALALTAEEPRVYFSANFFAEMFVFLNTGPLNALLANVVSPAIRSTAFAANIVVIHLLGDALSPTLIGMLSDRLGLASAFMITPAMLAVAGLVGVLGIPRVGPDMQRMESMPRLAEA
jgi:hypothetical protein